MDLLSPASAFRFPMPGGDCQSLQRHRSTSTPNVHMVSTVGPTGINIIEVSFGFWFVLMKQQTDKTRPLWKQTDAITSPQSLQLFFGSCCTDNIRVLHYLNHKRNMLLLLNPPMPCLRYSRENTLCTELYSFIKDLFFLLRYSLGQAVACTWHFSHLRHIESVNL